MGHTAFINNKSSLRLSPSEADTDSEEPVRNGRVSRQNDNRNYTNGLDRMKGCELFSNCLSALGSLNDSVALYVLLSCLVSEFSASQSRRGSSQTE